MVAKAPRRYPHPQLDALLVSAESVRVVCEDCGHSGTLDHDRLQQLNDAGCSTFGQLGNRLKCHDCYAAGGLGRSVTLEAFGIEVTRTASQRSRERI